MMEANLRIAILIVAALIFIISFHFLRKGRIPIKFSLLWFFISLVLLFVALFPSFLLLIMNFLGFQTLSNMVVGILFIVLFFITIALTIIVSGQTTKINLLIQELSISNRRLEALEKKVDKNDEVEK